MSFFKKKNKDPPKEASAPSHAEKPAVNNNNNSPTVKPGNEFGSIPASASQPQQQQSQQQQQGSGPGHPALSNSFNRPPPPGAGMMNNTGLPQNANPSAANGPPPMRLQQQQQSQQQQQQQQLGGAQPSPPPPQQQPPTQTQSPAQQQQPARQPGHNIIYPWSHRPLHHLPPAPMSPESSPLAGRNAPMPFPRYGHSVVPLTNPTTNDVYIFGGLVNDRPCSDLYVMACVPNSASYINALRERNPRATDLPQPGSLNIQWVETVGEVPGPRLGHASVGLGNVIITWGGDTNTSALDADDADADETLEPNDDALYLLNLGTREWTRVETPGPRPVGRYGHAAAIVGSRFFVFGGQSSGQVFMNDLWVFDLQMLKGGSAQWTQLEANSSTPRASPSQRTGHSIVTHGDCLYVFGGTDGQYHYNDTWEYNTVTRTWTELQCSGYIPVPREGHSATLVDDVMYVFAGRGVDGRDLEDLAAFKITGPEGVARRWFMFQHMGPTPSGRSGHAMASWGPKVFVLGGESYNGILYDPNFVNILDTSKIKYPTAKPGQNRKSAAPPGQTPPSSEEAARRAASPTGGQRPVNGIHQGASDNMMTTNAGQTRSMDPRSQPQSSNPAMRPARHDLHERAASPNRPASPQQTQQQQQHQMRSLDSQLASSTSSEPVRNGNQLPYPGYSTGSPAQASQQQPQQQRPTSPPQADVKRADVANPSLSRSAPPQPSDKWLLAALSQAHASGYKPSDTQVESALTSFDQSQSEQSRQQLLSVVLALKQELAKAKATISSQSNTSFGRMQSLEASRDAAVKEASYLKAKLAAVESGSTAEVTRIEREKTAELERQLSGVLASKQSLESQHQRLAEQLESERKLKADAVQHAQQANARADASESSHSRSLSEFAELQKRFQDHDSSIQHHVRDLSAMRGNFTALQADHDHTRTRLEASEGSLDTYLRTLEETQMAFNTVNAELTEMRRQCDTSRAEMATAQNAAQSLRAELEAKALEASQLSTKLEQQERMLDLMREEKEALAHLTSGNLAELLAATRDTKTREASLLQLSEQKLAALSAERDDYRGLHDQARDGHSASQRELAQTQERHNQLQTELLALRSELSTTRTHHQSAKDQIAQLQSQLASQNDTLDQHRSKLQAEETKSHTLRSILSDHGLADSVSSEGSLGGGASEAGGLRRRVRELEGHIETSQREANTQLDQLRQQLAEQRALSPTSSSRDKATEAELAQLQDRHKGLVESHAKAVQYVKGTEKMLRRMKEEVNKHKGRSEELESQLAASGSGEARSEVDAMRTQVGDLLRMSEQARIENKELSDRLVTVQSEFQQTLKQREAQAEREMEDLKAQASQLEEQLRRSDREIATLKKGAANPQALKAATEKIESLKRQNEELEDRCQQAESRVGLLLDHFEKGETRSETSSMEDSNSRISAGSEFASDRIGALLGSAAPGSSSHDQHSLDSEELRSTYWKDDRLTR